MVSGCTVAVQGLGLGFNNQQSEPMGLRVRSLGKKLGGLSFRSLLLIQGEIPSSPDILRHLCKGPSFVHVESLCSIW